LAIVLIATPGGAVRAKPQLSQGTRKSLPVFGLEVLDNATGSYFVNFSGHDPPCLISRRMTRPMKQLFTIIVLHS
jgi:hypothetical protein